MEKKEDVIANHFLQFESPIYQGLPPNIGQSNSHASNIGPTSNIVLLLNDLTAACRE